VTIMANNRSKNSRNHRNNPYALDGIAARFHYTAAGVLWRWRTELALAASAAACAVWLSRYLTPAGIAVVLLVAVTVVMALPWTSRSLLARAWCVVSRHRLQRLFFETRMHTRSGRLPLILRIHPTKVGERAHIWCRAGICLEDFEAHIGEIRAACYARDARVARNTRWAQLVTIDIIRHDLLAPKRIISAEIADGITPQKTATCSHGSAVTSPPSTATDIPAELIRIGPQTGPPGAH